MKFDLTFSEMLQASRRSWISRKVDECVLSLALPIENVDPLFSFPLIANKHQFGFIWDLSPEFCLAATGKCQSFELVGQRRYELSQRFTDETFNRLIDISPDAPSHAKPRILYAFTFFEQTSGSNRGQEVDPAVQAVLPSWQLTTQSHHGWLRLNAVVPQEADVRDFAEKLWLMRQKLNAFISQTHSSRNQFVHCVESSQDWEKSYRLSLAKGIDLVNSGQLEKLVVAVKQSLVLKDSVNPLMILKTLRNHQQDSCRFLWKRSTSESFFGASPERLLSIRHNNLVTDSLAGTSSLGSQDSDLLKSEKDLREHELVVNSINIQLSNLGLLPQSPSKPCLARYGNLVHLHTPITASLGGQSPLQLVNALHPTPAVAGLPREMAKKWLRTLEPFDRGFYAAPIGWIDTANNAEFRVGIRCGYARARNLDLFAGAGLVKGSNVEDELKEVRLKFGVITDQIFSRSKFSG